MQRPCCQNLQGRALRKLLSSRGGVVGTAMSGSLTGAAIEGGDDERVCEADESLS